MLSVQVKRQGAALAVTGTTSLMMTDCGVMHAAEGHAGNAEDEPESDDHVRAAARILAELTAMKTLLRTRVLLAAGRGRRVDDGGGRVQAPVVAVRSTADGVYTIAARFSVPEPATVVQAVLTDHPNIPRFMPTVRASRVLEDSDGRVRLEQEAVSKFMMFSRTVHLVLDVEESDGTIRFRDGCHKSFVVYDGSWTTTPQGAGTELLYGLTAKPAFSVPGMVLKRLLERDSREMLDGLRAEITARGRR